MPRTNPHLIEWQQTLENARSFNTLLLQLRGFGIPIVITIMGGGVAFAANVNIVPGIPVRYAHFILLAISAFLTIVIVTVILALRTNDKIKLTSIEKLQGALLIAVPIVAIALTFIVRGRASLDDRFVVTNPGVAAIVLFGLFLLLGLYGIDRCYYYRLLIGAVLHAEALEGGLGFSLTSSISKATPGSHSKMVITTMYWLPAFGALLAIATLAYLNVWTGHTANSSDGFVKCLMSLIQ